MLLTSNNDSYYHSVCRLVSPGKETKKKSGGDLVLYFVVVVAHADNSLLSTFYWGLYYTIPEGIFTTFRCDSKNDEGQEGTN